MPRYWVVAPIAATPRELFDRVWRFDVANNLISIGWEELGDVSAMSREELAESLAFSYPEAPSPTIALYRNMIWAFYHEILPGDLVIARRGRMTLAAVGTVTHSAIYAPGRNPATGHRAFLEVAWREQPRDRTFPNVVFPMRTVVEISEEQYRSFVEGPGMPVVITGPPEAIEEPSAFALEKYLEDFIVNNFTAIFQGTLRIYEDAEGNDGQQYATGTGRIDILAVELRSNSFVVIELKKGRPSDQVIGQILSYMGWVKRTLCAPGQAVKGLVICRDPDPKLSDALAMTNNIDVRYYTVSFTLREAP